MDGPNIGYATVSLIPVASGMQAAMASQVKGPAAAAGSTAGKVMGVAMKGALTGALAGVGAIAGLAKLGGQFDEQFDKIRVGTGATGEALEGLQGSFKNVLSTVPASFEDAGSAIADLNTRLGLTGQPLETLSSQFINLSRITGTDVATNVDNMTRLFGDWGLAAEDQAGALDKLYRAAQASGIGIDELSTSAVQFGAPLRNLGFGLDESLALLAQFNKTGVNTETVFAGLKAGVGKLAKDGEAVPEVFGRIVDQITKLGPGSEATGLAIELFGQRAGPDLADAIAGGKFELDGMLDAITNGDDRINKAAQNTEDFSEKWLLFKNKVLVGLEPLATRVFDALGTGMDWVSAKAPIVAAWFSEHIWPAVRNVGEAIGNAVAIGFAVLSDWWANNGETVTGGLKSIGEVISGAVDAGFSALSNWWDTNGDTVTGGIRSIGDFINDPVIPAMESLRDWIKDEILPKLSDLFEYIKDNEYVLKTLLVGAIGAVTLAFWAWAAGAAAAAGATIIAMGAAVIAYLPFILIGAAIAAIAAGLWYAYENWGWFRFGVELAKLAVEGLYGALQTLYDWLDDVLGKAGEVIDKLGEIKVPGVSAGGGFGLDDLLRAGAGGIGLREFDTGGIVPGPRGSAQLALVHGGETILPTHKQDYSAGDGGLSGQSFVYNIYNPTPEPASESIITAGRRNASMMGGG